MNKNSNRGVLCIVGPTASGKSGLGYWIAQQFCGEIVNFDSRQVYRDFPILSDQPGSEYTAKVPHWLYGFLDSCEKIDAAHFQSLARKAINNIQCKKRLPLLVGGTGLYLQSVLYGLDPVPEVPRETRQEILQEWNRTGREEMYLRLQEVDPEYARKVHPNDKQRVTRALEVYRASGKPFSHWHKKSSKKSPKYDFLKIGVWMDVSALTAGLEQRIEQMLKRGAVQEVKLAWEKNPREDAPAWSAIGSYELLQFILGRWGLEQAKKKWLHRTKKYAKRQLTWFKKDSQIHWVDNRDEKNLKNLISSWVAR